MSIFESKWAATGAATVLGVGFIALGTIAASATGLLPASPEVSPIVTLSPAPESTSTVDDDEVTDESDAEDGVSDDIEDGEDAEDANDESEDADDAADEADSEDAEDAADEADSEDSDDGDSADSSDSDSGSDD